MGYGLVGLQIFVPLSHDVMLVFYDKDIYKVGGKKRKYIEIVDEKEVSQFNLLQFVNCLDTIFFDEKCSEKYIRDLHTQSQKYRRANLTKSELGFLKKDDDEFNKRVIDAGFRNLMLVNKTDCEISLQIYGLNVHSKGKEYQFTDHVAQLRPHARMIKNREKGR